MTTQRSPDSRRNGEPHFVRDLGPPLTVSHHVEIGVNEVRMACSDVADWLFTAWVVRSTSETDGSVTIATWAYTGRRGTGEAAGISSDRVTPGDVVSNRFEVADAARGERPSKGGEKRLDSPPTGYPQAMGTYAGSRKRQWRPSRSLGLEVEARFAKWVSSFYWLFCARTAGGGHRRLGCKRGVSLSH